MKLEICDITKQYKDKRAVDHVSLTLTPGIWGLLGANGAGKTTLMYDSRNPKAYIGMYPV